MPVILLLALVLSPALVPAVKSGDGRPRMSPALVTATASVAATAGTPSGTTTPHASATAGTPVARANMTPSATAHPALSGRVSMSLVDYLDHRVAYRVVGSVVQRSTDAGWHWATLLSPDQHRPVRTAGCRPAGYGAITGLYASGLFPNTLFVTTGGIAGDVSGRPGDGGSRGHGGGQAVARGRQGTSAGARCATAPGGLFVLRPDGRGGVWGTDSQAAGLPYAQDAHARLPRAYMVRDLTADPTNPNLFYAAASIVPGAPGGPGSPRAGLYRSLDGGRSWQPALRGLPTIGQGRNRAAASGIVLPNPAHGAIVFDVIGTRLYRSTIHGGAWNQTSVRATRSLRLFINPFDPLLVYAVTDRGLYYSRDTGATWTLSSSRHLPAPRVIRQIQFNAHAPALVLVTPAHGRALHLTQPHTPAPPRFDLALTLTPLVYDRVVLALHAAPLAGARLAVVRGANATTARLVTDRNGFGHAVVRLTGRVIPAALRVRVEFGRRRDTLTPWLQPGWTPGAPPPPPATPTPRPTATSTRTPVPTATATPSPTATATAVPSSTSMPLPTAYPPGTLGQVWTWKALTPVLPICPPLGTPGTQGPASATPSPLPSATSTVAPTSPLAAGTSLGATSTPPPTATATATPSPSPSPSPTYTPVPSCDAGPPLPRQDYAAGWDNADRRLFVFGGTDSHTAAAYNDISSYSTITGAWSIVTPATAPPSGRYGAASVWDPVRNELLVFGGMVGAGSYARFSNDVWAYAPAANAWTQLWANGAAGGPTPRAHAAAAWDATNNRLLVFGGQTDDNALPTLTGDLWAFTPGTSGTVGGTWANLAANVGDQSAPPPRQAAQIGWDTTGGVLRLFGGKNAGSGAMSDTWAWSPSGGWSFVDAPDQPPGRQAAGYDWDATHNRFIVGPGVAMPGDNNDVWEYESPANDWLQVPVGNPAALPPRQMERLVWDAADNEALLFGGRQAGGGASNDLWALIPTGTAGPAPTPPPAPGHVAKGVDLGQTVTNSGDTVVLTSGKVQAAVASGAAYVRLSFYIGDGNTSWTTSRLHAYEKVIAMLAARGLGILAVASAGIAGGWSASSWTQGAQETTGGNGDNPAIENYVQDLAMLVGHFRPAPYNVARWELWNEPNVPLVQCATIDTACLQSPSLQPSNFAALLLRSYQAIKGNGATGDVQLISGGIFGHSINGSYSATSSGADYIARTYDEGINHGIWPAGVHPLDGVGEHVYVDQSQRTTPVVIRTYLDWFRAAYAGSDPAKNTIITEAGWRTGDPNEPQVTPDMQAYNLVTTFGSARRAGYVSDLSWFELQDNPGDQNSTSWGLVNRYGAGKPAYSQFQQQ